MLGIVLAGSLYFELRYSGRSTPAFSIAFGIITAAGLLIWTLSSNITKQIELDYSEKTFNVIYHTVLRKNNKLIVPFSQLTYSFDKEPSFRNAKKWTLRIYQLKRKVFQLETNDDGFSQDTVQRLAEHLHALNQRAT